MKSILMIIIGLLLVAPQAAAFSDVGKEKAYAESVNWLKNQGIVQGYSRVEFGYNHPVSRAEFLKVLMETAELRGKDRMTNVSFNCFEDVGREWFAPYICRAKEKNWVQGYSDGRFLPAQNVSFAEGLKLIMQVFEIDYKPASPWYREMIKEGAQVALIPGSIFSTFQPLTRGEMAEMVVRAARSNGDESPDPNDILRGFDPLGDLQDQTEVELSSADLPQEINLNVPFTAQAPFGNWILPYSEACEEASLIMVDRYLKGEGLDAESASREIVDMVEWEEDNGYIIDISASEAAEVAITYLGRKAKVYYDEDVSVGNIKKLLAAGHPVIIPAAGRSLGNPNFVGAGPPYHMLVLVGYDSGSFYANDPGTSRGGAYRYDENVLYNAIHDWTGSKSTASEGRKAMLILE